jgi:hypothetical protein
VFRKCDLKNKINTFIEINELIKTNLSRNVSKEFELRLHKIREIPALLFGSEISILKSKYKKRLQAHQKRHQRPATGNTATDHTHNETIT